ncbi:MAG: hypothetical protein H6822_33865 [Planctomycetaceae bacterium]|nr:hypothetical protein [Planctomycetales bacterium]MCB9927175.1 hypothetical protein [Planctomycetaceae bacterium]
MNRKCACRCLCFIALNILSCPVFAARYVPIKVYLDGQVILEGNASDDGSPDADEVWDALKQVNLGETEAFKKLFGKDVDDEFTILKRRKEREQPLKITIDVAYGGVAETTGLRIRRMHPDGAGRVWRIQSEEVSDLFNERLIRRSDVARLSNLKRSK